LRERMLRWRRRASCGRSCVDVLGTSAVKRQSTPRANIATEDRCKIDGARTRRRGWRCSSKRAIGQSGDWRRRWWGWNVIARETQTGGWEAGVGTVGAGKELRAPFPIELRHSGTSSDDMRPLARPHHGVATSGGYEQYMLFCSLALKAFTLCHCCPFDTGNVLYIRVSKQGGAGNARCCAPFSMWYLQAS